MIFLANLLQGIAVILDSILNIMIILVIARVVLSWVNADPYNTIVRIITSTVDPITNKIREKLPVLAQGGLDFSPIVLTFVLILLRYALVQTIAWYAQSLLLHARL